MTAEEPTTGPGRRLTPEQEQTGAEMFAAGSTDRQVAAALECGAGTANRLRQRLAGRIAELGGPGEPAADQPPVTELEQTRDALARALTLQLERAAASAQAIEGLGCERLELLAAGRDAAPLRPRLRSAEDDRQDYTSAAVLLQSRLDEVNGWIAQRNAAGELAAAEGEMAAAATEAAALAASAPDVLRTAAEAVRAAAAELVAFRADLAVAQDRVTAAHHRATLAALALGSPVPPPSASTVAPFPGRPDYAVPGDRDEGLEAVTRAWEDAGTAAAGGHPGALAAARVAPALAAAGDLYIRVAAWENGRAERDAEAEQLAAVRAGQLAELEAAQQRGLTEEVPVPVGTDHFGNPVDRFGNVLVPRGARLPHPLDVYNTLGSGPAGSPGYRTGG